MPISVNNNENPVPIKNIYTTPMQKIQDAIDADNSRGNAAAAQKLQAEVEAEANIYNEQNQLAQQILDDIARLQGSGGSGGTGGSSGSSGNSSGTGGAGGSSTTSTTPGGIFGLFQ